jgi:tRNA threonylcarbamoyladenosine biosynthesis protein TsaE
MTILNKDIYTDSEEDTFNLGKITARSLSSGLVVGFKGELGSGKTVFIKGILAGLGYEPKDASSASFVLAQEYKAKIPVVHIDLYRLVDRPEIFDLDIDQYSLAGYIVLIEWAEKIENILDLDIIVKIDLLDKENRRLVNIGTDNLDLLRSLNI